MPGTQPEALRWLQTGLELGAHELRGPADELIATLRFAPRPAVQWEFTHRMPARGEAGDRAWDLSIERAGWQGFLGLKTTAHLAGTDTGRWVGGPGFPMGSGELADGRRLEWRGGTRRAASVILDGAGRPLVHFEPGSVFERIGRVFQ